MNEPVLTYAPGAPERDAVQAALKEVGGGEELRAVIGGEHRTPLGDEFRVVAPFDHHRVLATSANSTADDAQAAVDAALAAGYAWRTLDFDTRAAILLRAADLLSGPWRARMNAATMLGQAKTVQQAEIDSACELADFWRFNVHFARELLGEQPMANSPGVWNRTDHRPLEGFVYAVTPFNFTAIAGNLCTAPALLGNVVVWKPAATQQLAASLIMELLHEAGMPDGVVNMLPGHGPEISQVVLAHPELAGIHFTGSTAVFHQLWQAVRREHRLLSGISAARRRNRRQGLRRRAPVRRRRCAARGPGARGVRVFRARSAQRRPARTSRSRCGAASGTTWLPRPKR